MYVLLKIMTMQLTAYSYHLYVQSLSSFFHLILASNLQPATTKLPVYRDACPLRAASLEEVNRHYRMYFGLSRRLQQLLVLAQRYLMHLNPERWEQTAAAERTSSRFHQICTFTTHPVCL